MKRWIIYFGFLIISVTAVNALGISPSDTYLKFEPYKTGSFEITLINSQNEPINASLSISGLFSEYFSMVDGVQVVGAGSSAKYAIEYSFPFALSPPGAINHDLHVNQIVDLKEGITASLNVVARVVVEVPYPERYLDYGLGVNKVNEGEELEFKFEILSKGERNIFGFKPTLVIYDPLTNEKITELEGKSSSLLAGATVTSTLKLNSSELGGGTFLADSFVVYDGIETPHKNITFDVGYEDIGVLEYPSNVSSGGIRKLVFLLRNRWNSDIGDVFIEIHLEKDGVPITERGISNGADMKAFEIITVPVYLDVSSVNPGNYQLVVLMKHGDFERTEEFDFSVVDGSSIFSKDLVVWFLIGMLVVANILWMILGRGKGSGEKTNDSTNKMELLQNKLGK